ncbi:MAG: N-acetyltransferase [Chitinophagaceae bacterium]|nr:MAG: N-acetyltransferase [Chitinophagaceae bacterium]
MIQIRKITAQEVQTVQTLATEIWNKVYLSIISQEQINYMLEKMYAVNVLKHEIEKGVQFFVAEKENKAIGFCAFELIEKQQYKLHKLYVQPETKGLHIGSQLLQYVENRIKENGGGKLILNVNKYNSAKIFYEKNGFVVESEGVFDIGNGFVMDDFIMSKTL